MIIAHCLAWLDAHANFARTREQKTHQCHICSAIYLLEALERLLINSSERQEGCRLDDHEIQLLKRLAEDPSPENLSSIMSNPAVNVYFDRYSTYKSKVRTGGKGKTPQLWLSFMDKLWILMRFLRATKTNNVQLHMTCLKEMCPLFLTQEKPNYARYTALYLYTLLNLPKTHPGAMHFLQSKGFSVNRSTCPNFRTAVDITIEQTYNRHASGDGPGIIGFSQNFSA